MREYDYTVVECNLSAHWPRCVAIMRYAIDIIVRYRTPLVFSNVYLCIHARARSIKRAETRQRLRL